MKKVVLLFLAAFAVSCSKDDSPAKPAFTISDTPLATVGHDATNFGIYKGVIADPSGILMIDINNEGTGVSARLLIDGNAYDFTSTQTVTEGESISAMTFTNGDMTFDFNVNENGTNAYVSDPVFPSHENTLIQVFKETSTQLIQCYLGDYDGSDTGTVNLIIKSNEVHGLTKSDQAVDVFYLDGTITDNSIEGVFDYGTFTGTKSNRTIDGILTNTEEGSGQYQAKRKL